MRWRRGAAVVAMAASAIVAGAAVVASPAAAGATDAEIPCVIDPETGECMSDRDRDGRSDTLDNCPDHYNPRQEDNDRDSVGNACDPTPNGEGGGGGGVGGGGAVDSDGDGHANAVDNCPSYYSTNNHCDSDLRDFMGESTGSSAPTTADAVNASCGWREYWRRGRQFLGAELFRYSVRIDWCWSATRVHSINVSLRPEIKWFCCWRFMGTITYDVRNTATDRTYYSTWPYTRFIVYAQGKFEQCLPAGNLGCPLQTRLPWVELTVETGGKWQGRSGGT